MWNWFIRFDIGSKPAAREQNWHHVCESSLFFCCCSCDFRVWDRAERKKKMWSGRLVSLPHLHEKQEGISIPFSLSSIYSSCQYYLINDPHALFKKQFGRLHFGKKKEREKYSCEHTFNPLVMSVNINKKEKKKMS